MIRALIISGGIFHPFAETSKALAAIAKKQGIDCVIEDDINAAIERLEDFDLLIVNALRWTMTQSDKYTEYRPKWALSLKPEQQKAIENFVLGGKGMLAMHTASICFDTWAGWHALLGGGWTWGESHHPAVQSASIQLCASDHPVLQGVNNFTVIDEIYHNLSPSSDVDVLATAEISDGPQPVVWAKSVGRGRVIYDSLGHDVASMENPDHTKILENAIAWLIENEKNDETD